jgi:hypothetical protein
MLSCKEVARLASDGLDQEMSLGKRFGMRLHMMMCGPCARYVKQLKQLRLLFSRYAKEGPHTHGESGLPDDARERISRTVDEALEQRDPSGG